MGKTTEMKGITTFRNIIYTAIFLLIGGVLHAQESRIDSLLRSGDILRMEYRFDESVKAYEKALGETEIPNWLTKEYIEKLLAGNINKSNYQIKEFRHKNEKNVFLKLLSINLPPFLDIIHLLDYRCQSIYIFILNNYDKKEAFLLSLFHFYFFHSLFKYN